MDKMSLYSANSFEEFDSLLQGCSYDEITTVAWSLRLSSELFVRWLIERFPERRRDQEDYVVQHDIAEYYDTDRICRTDLVRLVGRRCPRILANTLPLFKAKELDLSISGNLVPPDPYYFFFSSFRGCLSDLVNEKDASKRSKTLQTAEVLFDHYTDYLVLRIREIKADDDFFDLVRLMVKADAMSLLRRLSAHIDLTTFFWTEGKYAEDIKPWKMSPLALALLSGSIASFDYLKSLESDKSGQSRGADLLFAVVMKRHDRYDHAGALSYLFSYYSYGADELQNARKIALDNKEIFKMISAKLSV